jgi:hypothetical protein
MKSRIGIAMAVYGCFTPCALALVPLLDHIDIRSTYRPATQDWNWLAITENEDIDLNLSFFPARDVAFPAGERQVRAAGSQWDFMGVGAGERLWIYLDSSLTYSWLGFDDTPAGLQSPLAYRLKTVTGPEGGRFSMYRIVSGSPVVFMSTVDGIDGNDVFQKPAQHTHVSWTFSRKGMWAVDLQVSGFQTGGAPTVAGPTDTERLFFAIGNRAMWRASAFDSATVMDESVAGMAADADGDGFTNLLEYAFGGNPRAHGMFRGNPLVSAEPSYVAVQHEGETYAGISFFRRKAASLPETGYSVQWQSDDLLPDAWENGGVEHSVVSLDSVWEKVIYRDENPVAGGKRFVRVAVVEEAD